MIVVLCESFQHATDTFLYFLGMLEDWTIKQVFLCSNCVETDDDLRYIFIDERYESLFEDKTDDIMYYEDFLDGMEVPWTE